MSTDVDASFLVRNFDAPADPAALAGVLFADDFDLDGAIAEAPTQTAAAPVYDTAQLAAARTAGRADGLVAAQIDATVRARATAERAATALSAALEQARDIGAGVARDTAEALAGSVLRIVAAALPELCARHGAAEAQALTAALLPLLAQESRMVIRANPHTLAVLAHIVARQRRAEPERIRLVGTDELANGDVSIEWQDGRAVRDAAALCRSVAAALAPLGLHLPPADIPQTLERELADAG